MTHEPVGFLRIGVTSLDPVREVNSMTLLTVGTLVFSEVEVLNFCGPSQVFSATRLNEEPRRVEPSPCQVVPIAEGRGTVVAAGGRKAMPGDTPDDAPAVEVLVVPSCWGTRREKGQPTADRLDHRTFSPGHNSRLGLHWRLASGRCLAPRRGRRQGVGPVYSVPVLRR
jgi:hypothetical protein